MPFKSKRQLQVCFGKQLSAKAQSKSFSWDCEKWLDETPNPTCLPSTVGSGKKKGCRVLRKGEKMPSSIYEGPNGGLYFYAGGIKVYVPRNAKSYVRKNML